MAMMSFSKIDEIYCLIIDVQLLPLDNIFWFCLLIYCARVSFRWLPCFSRSVPLWCDCMWYKANGTSRSWTSSNNFFIDWPKVVVRSHVIFQIANYLFYFWFRYFVCFYLRCCLQFHIYILKFKARDFLLRLSSIDHESLFRSCLICLIKITLFCFRFQFFTCFCFRRPLQLHISARFRT